jgi:hypothetical protein
LSSPNPCSQALLANPNRTPARQPCSLALSLANPPQQNLAGARATARLGGAGGRQPRWRRREHGRGGGDGRHASQATVRLLFGRAVRGAGAADGERTRDTREPGADTSPLSPCAQAVRQPTRLGLWRALCERPTPACAFLSPVSAACAMSDCVCVWVWMCGHFSCGPGLPRTDARATGSSPPRAPCSTSRYPWWSPPQPPPRRPPPPR